MNPRQARAIRDGVLATVLTAALLFGVDALGERSVPTPRRASPTPTVSPSSACAPAWTTVPSPNPDPLASELLGVTVVAANDAWAVGGSGSAVDPSAASIVHWDGKTWGPAEAADDGSQVNVLHAVDAAATDDVWAVGRASDGYGDRPLIERWDGVTWSLAEPPEVGTDGVLFGVAALVANDAWAVGSVGDPEVGLERALLLHWDGSSWNSVDVLSVVGGGRSRLSAVSATSATDVWAVGYHHYRPLVLHLDGEAWSRADTGARGTLGAVTTLATGEVWTVGDTIRAFDGSTWTQTGAAGRDGTLTGVAAISSADVWAVGFSGEEGTTTRALVQRWEGSEWTIVAGVGVPGAEVLTGVAASPDGAVWAVGYRDTARGRSTLIVRGTPCAQGG